MENGISTFGGRRGIVKNMVGNGTSTFGGRRGIVKHGGKWDLCIWWQPWDLKHGGKWDLYIWWQMWDRKNMVENGTSTFDGRRGIIPQRQ